MTDKTAWILFTLVVAVLIMMAVYRVQIRGFVSRITRSTARPVHHYSTKQTVSDLLLPWDTTVVVRKDNSNPASDLAKPSKWMSPKQPQPFDAFLALDFEGTCVNGSSFDYPNELIEVPVVLMRWTDKNSSGNASQLEIVDSFRSFVKPTWKPKLSKFCTELTGITQKQVDSAPDFVAVLWQLREFMVKHQLIDPASGNAIARFCWCTDGPWDLGDLLTKQCFHSRIQPPNWLQINVIDVRRVVQAWMAEKTGKLSRSSPNIHKQLKALGLEFEGRLHSGIDDTRNIARIVTELGRRGVKLEPNTTVTRRKRWDWMGKAGRVREEHVSILLK